MKKFYKNSSKGNFKFFQVNKKSCDEFQKIGQIFIICHTLESPFLK